MGRVAARKFRLKNVYDYAAGKLDWIGAGLPLDARAGGPAFVLDFIHRDAPTAH